jgi:hypothetical protein
MKENQAEFQEEVAYLNETVHFIQNEMNSKEATLSQKKDDLIAGFLTVHYRQKYPKALK